MTPRPSFPRYWLLLCLLSLNLAAQEEEMVELSSFVISSERDSGYVPPTAAKPSVAITLKKPANAVIMEVTLMNASEKQENRTKELLATVEAINQAAKNETGLRLEQREIQLRAENRRKVIFYKSGASTSLATVALIGELDGSASLFEVVKKMRAALSSVKAAGATKVTEGAVSFLMRDVDQYRQELLTKIFEDVNFVKKGIGAEFEVLLSGLDEPIQTRPCSEREVELWIDYSFSIRSIRELERPRVAEAVPARR
jgi:hypothetical protein